METLKNFATGLFVVLLGLIILGLGFLLRPFLLGIGSLVLFVCAVVVSVMAGFYIIALIGYIVRKSFKKS